MGYLILLAGLTIVLVVEIAKRADGSGLLRCTRADGSVTWQKQKTHHALHFAFHDLTHFAVESTLAYRRGFFGLIAEGWEIEDTTGKGSRGPLPPEAGEVEHIVGMFDMERGSGVFITSEDFIHSPRRLSDAEIAQVRACRGELFSRWSALAAGGTLELRFSAEPRPEGAAILALE
jgi:hypothetical protein